MFNPSNHRLPIVYSLLIAITVALPMGVAPSTGQQAPYVAPLISTAIDASFRSSPVMFIENARQLSLSTGSAQDVAPDTEIAAANTAATQVTAGGYHTCALTIGGGVKCWGANESGELGNGTTTNSTIPVDVIGLASGVVAVEAGSMHTCALTSVGGVKCWGRNSSGQLGDGTTVSRLTPVDVWGLTSGVRAVSAGPNFTCAVTTTGTTMCWGDNTDGQLGCCGLGIGGYTAYPHHVNSLSYPVKAVSAGGNFVHVLTTAGGDMGWGNNYYGQLGNGSYAFGYQPTMVSGLGANVAMIATGGTHACAVTTSGAAMCWGNNYRGQVGGSTWPEVTAPVGVYGLNSGVGAIAAGSVHTCAVTSAGAAKCWGDNGFGELGDGTTVNRSSPVDVIGLASGALDITAGYRHTCAVTSIGGIKCWGLNSSGQLGDGTTTRRSTPTDVSGFGPSTYTISGRVTDASGVGIPGVTVWAGSSLNMTTDASGSYSFAGLSAGTYNISPSRYLYAFSPAARTVTVPPNATGQDFIQTPVVDLSVNRIEVAQVFVDTTTTPPSPVVPLIAKKDSLVRVFVNVTGVPALGAVTARLHLRDAKGVEHVLQETYPPSAIWARQNPDVRLLQDTVNFRPNPEWLVGVVALWADVDPYGWIPETDETNNTNATPVTATFVPGKKWRIAWTSVGYFDGHEIHWPDPSIVKGADQRLRTIYPVGKDDVEYFYQPGMSEILGVPFAEHDQEYVNAANRFYRRVAAGGAWVDGNSADRLFAWAWDALPKGEANPVCGHSDPTWFGGLGRVAAGIDKCDKPIDGSVSPIPAANTLAHEIGHTLWREGLHHPEHETDNRYCFGYAGEIGYHPIYDGFPKASIGAYGLDIARRWVVSPNTNYDFMAYCWPTWISPFHYTQLYDRFVEHGNAAGNQANTATTTQLLLSGLVYTQTMQTVLDPFYVLRSATMPDPDTGTDYCIELRGAGQNLLDKRCFDLAFRNIETNEPADADGFVLMTPYPAGTAQIILTHLGTPIATRPVSAHAPTVRLLSPNGGENWVGSGTYTVTWTASDLDGDALHFALAYSTDGGASWIPAGSDLTGTQHALDVSMLPGGSSVLLRISATDGVNTTDDVSDAPFTVGRKAPMAFILSPEDGMHFFPGQAIWLEGRGFDLEDGTLGDAALRWSSNRDGELGTGKLLIATLSPGEHTITLTATDSDSARATATIRLSAGDRVFLPMVLRGR